MMLLVRSPAPLRDRQRHGDTPAVDIDPLQDRVARYPDASRPLGRRQRFSLVNQETIVALIVSLFSPGRPPAVLARVWAVSVDAIDRVPARWTQAHVREEIHKRAIPCVAYRDASAPIIWKAPAIGIVAALPHHAPGGVLRRIFHAVDESGDARSVVLAEDAPTTPRGAAAEAVPPDNRGLAATARTRPIVITFVFPYPRAGVGQDGQAPERRPSDVSYASRQRVNLALGHDSPFHEKGGSWQGPGSVLGAHPRPAPF